MVVVFFNSVTTNFFFFFPEVSLSHQEKKRCLNFNLFLVIYITNNKLLVNQARRFNNSDDGIIINYSFPGSLHFFLYWGKIFFTCFCERKSSEKLQFTQWGVCGGGENMHTINYQPSIGRTCDNENPASSPTHPKAEQFVEKKSGGHAVYPKSIVVNQPRNARVCVCYVGLVQNQWGFLFFWLQILQIFSESTTPKSFQKQE